MTQTLRRELRQNFEGILWERYDEVLSVTKDKMIPKLAELLADSALSLQAFQPPKTIEEAIFRGVPVTQELADVANLRDTAPKMFEKALGFSKALPWWDGDKEWKALGEWVCERYAESKTSFGEYNIWRNTKYTKGGIANTRLRGFPAEFYDSWDMFMMSKEPVKEVQKLRML